jgi:hypothetical protein
MGTQATFATTSVVGLQRDCTAFTASQLADIISDHKGILFPALSKPNWEFYWVRFYC